MKRIKKFSVRLLLSLFSLYVIACFILYFQQERLIFHPEKLSLDLNYNIQGDFEEKFIKTDDGDSLNCLHFKVDSPKGVVLYLHGNAGSLKRWGGIADKYTKHGYDFIVYDFRSFGKSSGELNGEEQFFSDAQLIYNYVKSSFEEDKITVIGYSIGSAAASMLAANNTPDQLILKAPYYELSDLVLPASYYLVPKFILKYPFETYYWLDKANCPVTIFHGDKDQVIPFENSVRLKDLLKEKIRLIKLVNQNHSGLNHNEDYLDSLVKLLN